MTCIAGIKTENNVFIGGDTLGSNGFAGQSYVRPKIFKKDNFLFGVCGSYRLMQLLEFNLIIPKKIVNENFYEFLYSKFVNAIRECVRQGGILKIKEGIECLNDSDFLFAHNNNLYKMQSDFSILESTRNYVAIGSGCYHAEASLYSTDGIIIDSKERIRKAIICASNYVLSVNDKIDIISLNEEKPIKKRGK